MNEEKPVVTRMGAFFIGAILTLTAVFLEQAANPIKPVEITPQCGENMYAVKADGVWWCKRRMRWDLPRQSPVTE